jgi:ComF family protein
MMTLQELRSWQPWVDAALALIYPNRCQFCDVERATAAEGYVCTRCWSRPGGLQFIVPPFCSRCGLPFEGDITTVFECSNCREVEWHIEHARAAVAAKGLVREVIHRYKYQRALWFEPFLADLLIRQARMQLPSSEWDLIVPVPLHAVKQREREFNQAERLARRLSQATGISVNARLLRRVLPTRTQTQLSRTERAANVRRAFRFTGEPLHGERVVIVDDVLTTGATTNACAGLLREHGAAKVCVWTVARGL